MLNADLLIPYAFDQSGLLVHADDASKGFNYLCPCCNSFVTPKQGLVNRWHFAHKGKACNFGETAIHRINKHLIFYFLRDCLLTHERTDFRHKCKHCEKQHISNLMDDVAFVQIEKNVIDASGAYRRPDISLLNDQKKVIGVVEVEHTHSLEDAAKIFYANQRINVFRVRASRVYMDKDKVHSFLDRIIFTDNRSEAKLECLLENERKAIERFKREADAKQRLGQLEKENEFTALIKNSILHITDLDQEIHQCYPGGILLKAISANLKFLRGESLDFQAFVSPEVSDEAFVIFNDLIKLKEPLMIDKYAVQILKRSEEFQYSCTNYILAKQAKRKTNL